MLVGRVEAPLKWISDNHALIHFVFMHLSPEQKSASERGGRRAGGQR